MTQIIRSYEELAALDPDSILANIEEVYMPAHDWVDDYHIDPHGILPIALIADGEHVRAARQALQETHQMTPDQARELLEGTTPGPWEHEGRQPYINAENFVIRQVGKPGVRIFGSAYGDPGNIDLITAAPDMAATIARMTAEYAVESDFSAIEGEHEWEKFDFGSVCQGIIPNTRWTTDKETAQNIATELKRGPLPVRIVTRYVTDPIPLGESQ